ncbi:Piso0_002817 [Millerozyma farinosa CBS 7064]|uniref:General transcription and DNA repair factor IIH subunit TFB5 n=1 Tax=Pichia sorbitophila (strain ATCC MYA-4447 / BCRC 22081 / CBS 7064 / NBRC 10061 / NRRL Y-12695) TaxID=559304 RepID=G8YDL2_PICSO|nr:Piso0_002817 [Millerozyma farinosa CBS 7064]CCE83043.1 Piso0_002817 [Millerozyma farinosa CBS 7064]
MLSAVKGALVSCDPSIKALILKIDSERHDIIIEELDETHLVIDQNKIDFVKLELNRLLSKNIYDPFDDQ